MAIRRPFPLFNGLRTFVIDELIRRKTNLPTPISTPFARFTSASEDKKIGYKYFTLGLHGFTENDYDIFETSYRVGKDFVGYAYSTKTKDKNGYAKKKLITSDELTIISPDTLPKDINNTLFEKYSNRLSTNQTSGSISLGTHPTPGITDISIQNTGPYSPIISQVKWKCYNRYQLEFLRHQFMIIGNHVIIEWGHMFSDYQPQKLLNFGDPQIDAILVDYIIQGRIGIIEDWQEPNQGCYNFLIGFVGNFEVEFDPATNIYNCTTTVYTTGEQLNGLDVHTTYVDQQTPEAGKISSISDFFKIGSIYDKLLEDPENQQYIADFYSDYKIDKIESSSDLSQAQSNKSDIRFVSWPFFAKIIVPKMFSLLQNDKIKNDLLDFIKFTEDSEAQASTRIGDSPFLRSIDPETMIIIRQLNMTNIPNSFKKGGYFDQIGGGKYGSLNNGIWLNANAIRECFVQSQTFKEGLRYLLTRMSNATNNYWSLALFFDGELNVYRIVDEQYGEIFPFPKIYRYNVGTMGESLNISLSSAFPPELISQLSMIAKFKSESPANQANQLKDMPLMGTTSAYGFALNWTNLSDILAPLEAAKRKERTSGQNTPSNVASFNQGTGPEESDMIRSIQRLLGGTLPDWLNPQLSTSSPKPGDSLGNNIPMNPDRQVTPEVPTIRNSTDPITDPATKKLIEKAKPFDTFINDSSQRWGIDANLLRAIIATESSFNITATRDETDDKSYGLGQILLSTAKGYDKTIDSIKLSDPRTNIDLTARILSDNLRSTGNLNSAISAYNGGIRPSIGLGGPSTQNTRICLQWNPSVTPRVCEKWKEVKIGEYGNQDYINKVYGFYNQFKSADLLPTIPNTPTFIQQVAAMTTLPPSVSTQMAQLSTSSDISTAQNIAYYQQKFGSDILLVIEQNPSRMRNQITADGLNQSPPQNNFIAPFPTSARVSITTQGISGISIGDAFTVDKLPYIYDYYGVFQIVKCEDSISPSGWLTTIEGIYRLVWLDGSGPKNAIW